MYKKVYTILLLTLGWFLPSLSFAQGGVDNAKTDTAVHQAVTAAGTTARKAAMMDKMRSEGKIYVVVVCLVIILLGILTYVIRLDRKIKQLENDFK